MPTRTTYTPVTFIESSSLQNIAIACNYEDYITSDVETDYRRDLDKKYGKPLDVAGQLAFAQSKLDTDEETTSKKNMKKNSKTITANSKSHSSSSSSPSPPTQSYWSIAPKSRGTRNTMARITGQELGPKKTEKPQTGKKIKERYDLSKIPTFDRVGFLNFAGNPPLPLLPTLFSPSPQTRQTQPTQNPSRSKPPKSKSKKQFKSSTFWYPSTREEWDDCVSEMTSLCSQASLRRAIKTDTRVTPPLSELYIRERIDIDEPLKGVQVREGKTGWLQGFAMWTTFTTWTPYFLWNSTHPQSGMKSNGKAKPKDKKWDVDNKVGRELEGMERMGDPKGQGVVWPKLAEISLVGGVGCGEVLVTLALDALSSSTHYSYAVLQATPLSQSFYERFGFVRVGAVARYEGNNSVVGYRHWTYADEKHLKKHGGPSYMMALSLKEYRDRRRVEGGRKEIREAVERCTVDSKPVVKKVTDDQIAKVFGGKYSEFDRIVQSHPGFFLPPPKVKTQKKPIANKGPPKKRKRGPDIWMAVPLVEQTNGKRRVNKYTASKMKGRGGERKGKKVVDYGEGNMGRREIKKGRGILKSPPTPPTGECDV